MNDCTCDKCSAACVNKPGWFLPGEAERAAAHLGIPLVQFFRDHLGVDWREGEPTTFVLAPALTTMEPGTEYPGDPQGRCVFLGEDGLCTIHPVKPFECREYLHDQARAETQARHEQVADAWKDYQQQIKDLLGREPEEALYFGPFGWLFGGLFLD